MRWRWPREGQNRSVEVSTISSQYHLRKQMGPGGSVLIPSAHADGTDSFAMRAPDPIRSRGWY